MIGSADGKLAGFIHSAGVLKDSLLLNLTWDMFEEVYDSKHRPALYIHDALGRMEQPLLEFYWTFSSSSVYGNPGQTNYSGSNCFQDALSRHRRALGLPGCTMQWGAWGEAGMAANLDEASKKRFESGPQPPFTNEQGLRGLEIGLSADIPYFAVFRTNPTTMTRMVEGNGTVPNTYARNLTSEIYPTPLPNATTEFLYTMLRHAEWPYRQKKQGKLVYDAFIKPVKDMFEEPDEDGLVWA